MITVKFTKEEADQLMSLIARGQSVLPWRRRIELDAWEKLNAEWSRAYGKRRGK